MGNLTSTLTISLNDDVSGKELGELGRLLRQLVELPGEARGLGRGRGELLQSLAAPAREDPRWAT
jgi:hypothetical protein